MASGDLKGVEFFVFTDKLVFESVFYKGTSNPPLLFKLVLRLHQVQMRGEMILHVVHIAGTQMIEAGIDGLSRGKNLGGMMRGMNPLQFFLLDQGAVARSGKLELWIRTWWGDNLNILSAKYWF